MFISSSTLILEQVTILLDHTQFYVPASLAKETPLTNEREKVAYSEALAEYMNVAKKKSNFLCERALNIINGNVPFKTDDLLTFEKQLRVLCTSTTSDEPRRKFQHIFTNHPRPVPMQTSCLNASRSYFVKKFSDLKNNCMKALNNARHKFPWRSVSLQENWQYFIPASFKSFWTIGSISAPNKPLFWVGLKVTIVVPYRPSRFFVNATLIFNSGYG